LPPPSIGVTIYSSAVTLNIQTNDPHFPNKSSRMSQTFNQEYLLDLHHPLDKTKSTQVGQHEPLLDHFLAIVDPQRSKVEVKVLDVLGVMR